MSLRAYRLSSSLCFLALAVIFFERPAYAYVDPGSGLLAYQTLTAFLAGGVFYFRQKIRDAFRALRHHHEPPKSSM